ncbi:hypothetical protein [Larkinella insperata]|uniref:hypothetical protein n=1 Tax=Larkinella insperata TaxID=332158 RepID=UPI0022491E22|nr:hypothetical protein [Larkinella insperata]
MTIISLFWAKLTKIMFFGLALSVALRTASGNERRSCNQTIPIRDYITNEKCNKKTNPADAAGLFE